MHPSALAVAREEQPLVLLWTGLLLAVLTIVNYLDEPEHPVGIFVLDLGVAALFIGVGLIARRAGSGATYLPWAFVACGTVLVLSLAFEAYATGKPVTFAYITIVLTAMPPAALAWLPAAVGSGVSLAGIVVAASTWAPGHASEWILVSVGATLAGALLLKVRLVRIYELADANARLHETAVSDELTGLLNRRGLQDQVPRLAALAQRLDKPAFALFADVEGLKVANDRHGHRFGDEVLIACAQALSASVRSEDYVARWGGDEFLVLGIGDPPLLSDVTARLEHTLTAGGVDRGRWPGGLSVGVAVVDPAQLEFAELIERADADMYRRRQARHQEGP
jgi:diguanylate cyclase (GGDEF)-like protein